MGHSIRTSIHNQSKSQHSLENRPRILHLSLHRVVAENTQRCVFTYRKTSLNITSVVDVDGETTTNRV